MINTTTKITRFNKLHAVNLEPPFYKESKNGIEFFVRYISDGNLHDVPCTREVFSTIENDKLDLVLDRDFVMEFDNNSGMVVKITKVPKEGASYFDEEIQEQIANKTKGSTILILQKTTDSGDFRTKVVPEILDDTALNAILKDINTNYRDVKISSNDIIADNYMVVDVRRNGTYIYIDANALE